jgi:pimeloyl-ACP methyl ester carboxylesterase
MNNEVKAKEGFISFRGYKIWYRQVGGGEGTNRVPLLCLHGGPGVPHDYLEPLEALASTGWQVVFGEARFH